MIALSEIYEKLAKDSLFVDWKKEHAKGFLSHFFAQLSNSFELKTPWEIGFFDPDNNKITVFTTLASEAFAIKPADDVFKKEEDKVEELKIEQVKVGLEKVQETAKKEFPKLFGEEQFGDGFLIVQTIKDVPLWNFTLLSKSLKFCNLKINAKTGAVDSHQAMELIQR